jgi:hypothetical protein
MILLDSDVVNPLWGGLVTQRTRGSGDTVDLALATLESYFDRRFVGDVTYPATGQNAIVADIVTKYVATGALGGIPIRVVQVGGAGTLRDRTYLDADDKTVYSCLTELAGVIGGPEWTIEWEHQSSPERYTPVLYVGARIGTPVMAGLAPAAVFDLPGCVTDATYIEDYSAGKGANSVIASSSGVAGARPQSPAQIAVDDGRPTYEARFAPSTDITLTATLTDHAARMLSSVAQGSTALTLSAAVAAAPKLGTDWVLGDDVGYSIGGLEADPRARWTPGYSDAFSDIFTDIFGGTPTGVMVKTLVNPNGRDSVPAFHGGLSGVARCYGWDLSLGVTQIITPILVSGA